MSCSPKFTANDFIKTVGHARWQMLWYLAFDSHAILLYCSVQRLSETDVYFVSERREASGRELSELPRPFLIYKKISWFFTSVLVLTT